MRKGLAVWNPFSELEKVKAEFDNLVQNLLPTVYSGGEVSLAPAIDVYETDKEVVIKAEIPGVKKEDLEVSVKDNVLYIKGEKKEEKEENTEAVHRVERIYGKFERMISLPPNVKTQDAKAEYKDGVLEIRFPKKEESQSTKINIG
ncbi:MAG: Hsp20/alpha crystallin family protein [Hydrogenobaculum sp.]|nr:MAG: Hsp20/alpha crystallin family protein [Hydrogenobaculum sp.]HEK25894.1 Hsp20/alpha crystallin family protein [Hydrogenobaculum sp.]